MKVAELARAGGVTAETVRHYTRQGLITARRDPVNNYQRFDEQALVRLKFISQARQLGFSLADIKQILEQADQHDSPCPLVRDLLRQHLPRVRDRIRELEAWQGAWSMRWIAGRTCRMACRTATVCAV